MGWDKDPWGGQMWGIEGRGWRADVGAGHGYWGGGRQAWVLEAGGGVLAAPEVGSVLQV